MPAPTLSEALRILKRNEDELRRMGVAHAAVFGSVARSEQQEGSDVDVIVDLDADYPIGIFEYARLKWFVGKLFAGAGDGGES